MSNSPPSSPFRRYRLAQAAQDGMLLICSCVYCRKQEAYWCSDLVAVYGDMAVDDFGSGGCICGARDGTRTRTHFPGPDDVGRLELTRPAGWTMLWHWRKEWLELPQRPLDAMDQPARPRDIAARQKARETPRFDTFGQVEGRAPRPRRR